MSNVAKVPIKHILFMEPERIAEMDDAQRDHYFLELMKELERMHAALEARKNLWKLN